MKLSPLAKLVLLPLLALAALGARAEDIDLYAGSTANGAAPNLLVILDNSAAWSSNLSSLTCAGYTPPAVNGTTVAAYNQCGLYNAVNAIGQSTSLLGNIKLGLMYFPTSSASGGQFYWPASSVASPASSLLLMDAAGITTMKQKIDALRTGADKSNSNQISETMQEAWAFYQGYNQTNPKQAGLSGAHYPGTNASETCGRNFVLYIATATTGPTPQDGTGQNAKDRLTTATGAVQPQLTLPSWPGAKSQFDAIWADEWAKFMYAGTTANASLTYPSITTYTIILTDGTNPDYEQYLVGMANAGGGKYFLVQLGDTSGLVQALLEIFNEVQAVNSVFASPGLPVTSNAQSTYLNQIFLASFRPDIDGKPRWLGNLKQYQFGVDTTGLFTTPATGVQLFLGDASWADVNSVTNQATYPANKTAKYALSSADTGFISPNAISYWTTRDTTKLPDSQGGFWINKAGIGAGYDLADGQYVEKGGISQGIRLANLQDDYIANPSTPRKLYTCNGSCAAGSSLSSSLFATTNANITATDLSAAGTPRSLTKITRTGTTATATLAAAPTPALTAGQTILIAGSQYAEFNGSFTVTPTSTTTFTYTPVTIDPPTPSTGSYSVTVASSPKTVTQLARSGTTVTATSTAHGYTNGQQVTIAGSTSGTYNGTYTVSGVTANNFNFTVVEGPTTPSLAGTATVGAASVTITTITRYTSNTGFGSGSGAVANPGVNKSIVTVNSLADIAFATGNTVVITGSSISAYNGSWQILTNGLGTNCPNGGDNGLSGKNKKPRSFCFAISTTPATPDTVGTITADSSTSALTITGITHAADTCTSSGGSASVLATATTATAPLFVAGQTVSVGGAAAAREGAYLGSYTVVSTSLTGFTYNITTSPACSDTKTGMTASTLGVARDTLIHWVRGEDGIGDEPSPPDPASPTAAITVRGSIHGDVLHSRPAVVNYGGTTGVVVFYGANDGVFRAINGNQPPATNTRPTGDVASGAATYTPMGSCAIAGNATCSIGGVAPGGELWGFVPTEFYTKMQRLYSNSPDVLLATTPTGILPTPKPKDYFFDGPTATYQTYDSSGNTTGVYIFLTARRGGRVMYAFDVTSPTDPKFMWKITNATSGFSELGQSWSQPKVAFVKGYLDGASKPKPVLIFGAGYDGNGYDSTGATYLGNDDKDPPTAAAMGRGIYIVDAITGALVWNAGPGGSTTTCAANPCLLSNMTYSMPADVTTIDTNVDGYVDRLYSTDTGGNIWRVDLEAGSTLPTPSLAPSTWQVTHLAALGGTVPSGASPRKFLFPPDVVVTKNFAAVLVGSGDREHPLRVQAAAYNTVNRFYMIMDTKTGVSAQSDTVPSPKWTTVVDDSNTTSANAPGQATLFNASTQPFNITSSICSGTGGCKGYYLVLNQNPQDTGASTAGEQVVNAATTIGGYTYFGTNQPKPADVNSCSANLGNARGYRVGFLTGTGGFTLFNGGGLPPSPVSGIVTVYVLGVPTSVPFIIGGGGGAVSGTTGGGTLISCSGPDCKSSLGGAKPPIPIPVKKKRTYWYRQIDP